MFTVCVSPGLVRKYVQFQIICSLFCCIIVDTFIVEPHSFQYEKQLEKPTNTSAHTKLSLVSMTLLRHVYDHMETRLYKEQSEVHHWKPSWLILQITLQRSSCDNLLFSC